MDHLLHTGIQTNICTLPILTNRTLLLQVQLLIHMHNMFLINHILTFLHIPSTIPILHLLDLPHILAILSIPIPLLTLHHLMLILLTLIPTMFLHQIMILPSLPFHTMLVSNMDHLIIIINNQTRPIQLRLLKSNLISTRTPIATLVPTGRRTQALQQMKCHKLVIVPSLLRVLLTRLWMIL